VNRCREEAGVILESPDQKMRFSSLNRSPAVVY
jgi:hypothetical protein